MKESALSVDKSHTLSCMPPKRRELSDGQFEDSSLKTMPVGYKTRRYSAVVAVSAVSKRNSRLPPALLGDDLESQSSVLISFFRYAFINKKTPRKYHLHTQKNRVSKEDGPGLRRVVIWERKGGEELVQRVLFGNGGVDVPARAGSGFFAK